MLISKEQTIKRKGNRMNNFQVLNSTSDKETPVMLSITELSKRTNLSYSFIRKLCIEKKIVYIKSGTKYLVNFNKFIEFLNKGTLE